MNTLVGIIVVLAIVVFVASKAPPESIVARASRWLSGLVAALIAAAWTYIANGGGQ